MSTNKVTKNEEDELNQLEKLMVLNYLKYL